MRLPSFAYAEPKVQISCAVTAQLISAFVFTTQIAQFLFFLIPKFQASSLLVRLYRPVCVRLVWKPRRWVFSHRSSNVSLYTSLIHKFKHTCLCASVVLAFLYGLNSSAPNPGIHIFQLRSENSATKSFAHA